jgi:hypothetical protein
MPRQKKDVVPPPTHKALKDQAANAVTAVTALQTLIDNARIVNNESEDRAKLNKLMNEYVRLETILLEYAELDIARYKRDGTIDNLKIPVQKLARKSRAPKGNG